MIVIRKGYNLAKNNPTISVFILWVFALVIVNPIGEFPLNDDWAYSLIVRDWLETGIYHVNDWPAMSLFAQICWGTLFVKIFGFSFTALRFSTLILAAAGLVAFSAILKELNFSKETQLLAMAILLFNPLFFHLSVTFMTDVPFLSCCIIASYFYLKFLQVNNIHWWGLAVFFSICAVLIRQLGVFIPLAFLGAMMFCYKKVGIKPILLSFLAVVLTYFSLKGYVYWLGQTTGLPSTFSQMGDVVSRLSIDYIFSSIYDFGGLYLMYLGVFLLPILFHHVWVKNKVYFISVILLLFLFTYLGEHSWNRFPLGNTIYDLGLGTLTLPDTLRKVSSFSVLSPFILLSLKLIAALGVLLLSGHLAKKNQQLYISKRRPITAEFVFKLGILFFVAGYSFFLIIDYYRFDRYLLPLVPFTLILISPLRITSHSFIKILSISTLLIMACFSTLATHDYLAWNKARWNALNFLEQQNISPQKIDGGFEYNGWHQTYHQNPTNRYGKSWWFVNEDDYAVAFKPYHNYEVKSIFPFYKFSTLSIDTVYALVRPEWEQIDTFFYDMELINSEQTNNPVFDQIKAFQVKGDLSYSGEYVFKMLPQEKYAFKHVLFPIKAYDQLSISMYIKGNKKDFGIVNTSPNTQDFHYNHTPFQIEKNKEGWKLIVAEMTVPPDYPSDTLEVYLWKEQPNNIEIDDFKIIWRRGKR